MNHRPKPCAQCPWVKSTPPGQFPAERYEELKATTGSPGCEVPIGAPVFGCHKTAPGKEMPCAGWLAGVGWHHMGIRIAVATGGLPLEAVDPPSDSDYPEVFTDYEEMATHQGGHGAKWSACFTDGCRDHGTPTTVTPGYPCPSCGRGEMVDVTDVMERRRGAGDGTV
jgi:hypothetical protein